MTQPPVSRMPSVFTRSRRVLQNHETVWVWLQLLLDMAIAAGLLYGLLRYSGTPFDTEYRLLLVVTLLLLWIIYTTGGIHRRFGTLLYDALVLARGWLGVTVALFVIGWIAGIEHTFNQQLLMVWLIMTLVCQWLANVFMFLLVQRLSPRPGHQQPALVVGTQPLARYLLRHINDNTWLPEQVVGVVSAQNDGRKMGALEGVPILGSVSALPELVEAHGIPRVYIALPLNCSDQIETIYLQLLDRNVDIIWAPDIFGLSLLNLNVKEVAGVPLLSLCETPLSGMPALLKSIMDRSLSLVALCLLSPLMLMVALAIKLTSAGPVLFKQKRHGWDGQLIEVWKFRSMRVHREQPGKVSQAQRNDPRLTPIGGFLRRSSLDELPQLFNVLQGRMSLVGPRPHAVEHNDYYSGKIRAYFVRHRIKPGITGLAQVNGCRGGTETLDKMQQRVAYDLAYINNWSLWLDIRIMLKTAVTLFSKNAY